MKAGDVIKLNKGQIKVIKSIEERSGLARQMAIQAAILQKKAGEELWGAVFQMFPETVGFSCTLSGGKEIVVEREFSEFEKQCQLDSIAEKKNES